MINNRISDLITRIRNTINSTQNGWIIKNKEIKNSKEILSLLAKLASLGYIKYHNNAWYLRTHPNTNVPTLKEVHNRSLSSKRIYRKYTDIKEDEIVRTTSGYLTGYEAKKERKGGEIMMKIDNMNKVIHKNDLASVTQR